MLTDTVPGTDFSVTSPDLGAARDFTRTLAELHRRERIATVDFLLALAEFDGRRLWAALGYASLFEFLTRELRMSKGAAFYRNSAVGLIQRHPEVMDHIAEGRLYITALPEIAKVITADNARHILPRFFYVSTRNAREVVAELAPMTAPPLREVISVVKSRPASADLAVTGSTPEGTGRSGSSADFPVQTSERIVQHQSAAPCTSPQVHPLRGGGSGEDASSSCTTSTARGASAPCAADPVTLRRPPAAAEIQPLTAELRRIHVTVSKRWVEKFHAATAALSHSVPSGSAEEVLEAALDALLAREAKRKGLVKNPRPPRGAPDVGQHRRRRPPGTHAEPEAPTELAPPHERRPKAWRESIPAHVRRAVLLRDDAQCQAKLHDGTICGSRLRLQLDHIQPVALGGPSSVENLRLVCERHNQAAARAVFGETWMTDSANRRRSRGAASRRAGPRTAGSR